MKEELATLKDLLARGGYSMTAARREVFLTLRNQPPLSMTELLLKTTPAIDRSSVYRAITVFESCSIVERLQIGFKYKLELSDFFTHHHHHLTCLYCGAILPIKEHKQLETLIEKLANEQGFAAQSHTLEIRGTCTNCQ